MSVTPTSLNKMSAKALTDQNLHSNTIPDPTADKHVGWDNQISPPFSPQENSAANNPNPVNSSFITIPNQNPFRNTLLRSMPLQTSPDQNQNNNFMSTNEIHHSADNSRAKNSSFYNDLSPNLNPFRNTLFGLRPPLPTSPYDNLYSLPSSSPPESMEFSSPGCWTGNSYTKPSPLTIGIRFPDTDPSFQEKRKREAFGLSTPLSPAEEKHEQLALPRLLKIGQIQVNELTRIKEFKKGGNGTVYGVFHEKTSQAFALKILQNGKDRTQMENEINIFHILKPYPHKNIVQFFDAYSAHLNGPGSYTCCILMENCGGGSLEDFIKRKRKQKEEITDGTITLMVAQVLSALQHMEGVGIVHLDVKPANILMNREETAVKLADFGTSMDVTKDGAFHRFLRMPGTDKYKSPERVNSVGFPLTDVKDMFKADIWSLGICLLACCNDKNRWKDRVGEYLNGQKEIPSLEGSIRRQDIRDFLRLCLIKDPSQRPGATALLRHPFIVNCQE